MDKNEILGEEELPESTSSRHPEMSGERLDDIPDAEIAKNTEDSDKLARIREVIENLTPARQGNETNEELELTPVTEVVSGKDDLSSEDLQRIKEEIHRTSYISYIPENIWRKMEEIYVTRINGDLVGLLALVDLGDNWVEVGPLLIIQEYPLNTRARVAMQLLQGSEEGIKGRNAFWTSHNPSIQKFGRQLPDFKEVSLLDTLKIPAILKRHLGIVGANIKPANRRAMTDMQREFGPKPKDATKTGNIFAIKYAETTK